VNHGKQDRLDKQHTSSEITDKEQRELEARKDTPLAVDRYFNILIN
jgi:hypothetical protein